MGDLVREEVEKAVELLGVTAKTWSERGGIELRRRLERADVQLEPLAKALHASENADGVALTEAGLEQLHVAPDARLDASARVDQLEREIGRAGLRTAALLSRDRIDTLDDPVLLELRDVAHSCSFR
jgi:hypothetical protein